MGQVPRHRLLGQARAVEQHQRHQIVACELAAILAQQAHEFEAIVFEPVAGDLSALPETVEAGEQKVAAGERGLKLQNQEGGMARAPLALALQNAGRTKQVLE